jgi:hypothetical protein
MQPRTGDHLGPYEILAPLGRGGMGEVYRARDTRLKREVAIKRLPEAFTADPARLARFQREAEVLAALDHPNIGAIHGLVEAEGARALVLALVEGPTLEERLAAGPLPLEEAVAIAQQIIAAVEYAHDRGVIHRDLKPANVKITPEGTVKVLDFGLAKVLDEEPAPVASVNSPTLTLGHTRAGVILGTAAYMSPEQAVGKPADRRSDIFSFGAVLYEMLTGERAFSGDSAPEILVSVAKDDPDWSKLPSSTPRAVRELLKRCLTKDRRQRLQAIGEARIVLSRPLEDAPETAPSQARLGVWVWVAMAVLAVIAGVALWGWLRPRPVEPRPVARFPLPASVARVPTPLIISPDGSRIAYVGAPDLRIYVRRLDQLEAQPLAGTEGASFLSFSPDGADISFSAGQLKKVSVSGGQAQTLAEARAGTGPPTTYWGGDHYIYFCDQGVLKRIPEGGGKVEVVASPDAAAGEGFIFSPQLLPGGKDLLISIVGRERGAFALNLATRARKPLLMGAEATRFISGGPKPTDGYLVYTEFEEGTVMAVPFDAGSLELLGEAVPVLDGLRGSSNGPFGPVAISASGTLVYAPGSPVQREGTLAWVDRKGVARPLDAPAREYNNVRVSPTDSNRVAATIAGGNYNSVWVYDVGRGTLDPITTEALGGALVWTADGQRLIYEGQNFELMWAPADRSSPPSVLAAPGAGRRIVPTTVSADGKFVAGAPFGNAVWFMPMPGPGGEARIQTILASEFLKQNVALAPPDGRWIAYNSNDTGRGEVYVTSFPEPGAVHTISTGGGGQPRWSADGRELFYRRGNRFMKVEVGAGPTFSRPQQLFETDAAAYDVAPDGRFLMILRKPQSEQPRNEITVVLNWFEELRRKAPLPE